MRSVCHSDVMVRPVPRRRHVKRQARCRGDSCRIDRPAGGVTGRCFAWTNRGPRIAVDLIMRELQSPSVLCAAWLNPLCASGSADCAPEVYTRSRPSWRPRLAMQRLRRRRQRQAAAPRSKGSRGPPRAFCSAEAHRTATRRNVDTVRLSSSRRNRWSPRRG